MEYTEFLKLKVVIAEKFGLDTSEIKYSDLLFPHQKDIVNFCLEGGRRAIFASFGLGKTFMQLGTHLSKELKMNDRHGGDINEFPQHLQLRQFPKV